MTDEVASGGAATTKMHQHQQTSPTLLTTIPNGQQLNPVAIGIDPEKLSNFQNIKFNE